MGRNVGAAHVCSIGETDMQTRASSMGILFAGLLATGCAATSAKLETGAGHIIDGDLAARTFDSPAELRSTIRAAALHRRSCILTSRSSHWRASARVGQRFAPAVDLAAIPGMPPPSPPSWSPSGGSAASGPSDFLDFSRTNVQHDGIDETHIIKTDGRYVYTVTESSLFIVDVLEGSAADGDTGGTLVGSAILPGPASGMLLGVDRVVVTGQFTDRKKMIEDARHDRLTYVAVFDVSSRPSPKLLARHVFEGRFVDGRLMHGFGYFVTASRAFVRNQPTPVVATGTAVTHVSLANTASHRQPRQTPSFATVHALSLASPKTVSSQAVLMGNPTVVYVSRDSVYLADTAAVNGADLQNQLLPAIIGASLTPADKVLIREIDAVDDAVFSPLERRDKIGHVYCDRLDALPPEEREELARRAQIAVAEKLTKMGAPHETAIHRVRIDGTSLTLGRSGRVSGRPLNQFAFDAYRGVLRVATTRSHDNAVFALNQEMKVVGKLDGLGKDERIYAVRYIAERAYLVTFKEVDPFYVVDVGDPKNIRKLGELKIPGVSRYLHPWGPNQILGIGTHDGARGGLKVSVFDVSDVTSPKEKMRVSYEDVYAELSRPTSHRSLIINPTKRLVVIPIRARQERGTGALILGGNELQERGRVFHNDAEWTHLGTQRVEGSVYVGERLFTKSPAILRGSALKDGAALSTIFLK